MSCIFFYICHSRSGSICLSVYAYFTHIMSSKFIQAITNGTFFLLKGCVWYKHIYNYFIHLFFDGHLDWMWIMVQWTWKFPLLCAYTSSGYRFCFLWMYTQKFVSFFYLKIRVREREISHLLFDSPDCHSGWSWVRQSQQSETSSESPVWVTGAHMWVVLLPGWGH